MFEGIEMVQPGWEIVGADDERIGDVTAVEDEYLHTTKGLLFPKNLYVPTEAVEDVDTAEGRVYLSVSRTEVEEMGWETPPDPETEDVASFGRGGWSA